RIVRRNRLHLLHDQEQADADGEARAQEVRPRGAQARRLQRAKGAASLEVSRASSAEGSRPLVGEGRLFSSPWSVGSAARLTRRDDLDRTDVPQRLLGLAQTFAAFHVHRKQDVPILELALVLTSFELRDAKADQRPRHSADGGPRSGRTQG